MHGETVKFGSVWVLNGAVISVIFHSSKINRHLTIWLLVNDQLDAQFFSMCLLHFSTCFEQPRAHHQEKQLYQYNIWYMSLCVGDIYQMYWYSWFSWWWARGCSKRVENLNKHIEKNCASSWSFTESHNRMHRQQNIKSNNTYLHPCRLVDVTATLIYYILYVVVRCVDIYVYIYIYIHIYSLFWRNSPSGPRPLHC